MEVLYSKTVDATSLFEACDTAMNDWSKLWWWPSWALLEIEAGDDRWKVNQAAIRKWREQKCRRP
jgi:hypothetical protein